MLPWRVRRACFAVVVRLVFASAIVAAGEENKSIPNVFELARVRNVWMRVRVFG